MLKIAYEQGCADALEKLGYDYKHETRELHGHHKDNSEREPTPYSKSVPVGAAIGALPGMTLGGLLTHGKGIGTTLAGAGLGALAGGGLGALGGALYSLNDEASVDESKEIMAMNPRLRQELLQHLARQSEIDDRQRHEDLMAERRHRQMLHAVRNQGKEDDSYPYYW